MNRSPYEQIKSTDEALWREGLNALLIEHSEKACAAIISILSDNLWHKREAAARILCEWGNELVEVIEKRLDAENQDEFYWLLNVLGKIGTEKAFSIVRNFLSHSDSEVRSYAVRALTHHKNIENARPLYPLLNDNNWAVRKLVFEQLLEFDSQILDDLRQIIRSPERRTIHSIIALFVKIGKDPIVGELKQYYGKGNFQMRLAIISALGELGSNDAIDFIVSALSDPSWAIRNAAGEQLTKMGPKVFDKLTAAFARSDSLIKHKIISILVEMLEEKSLPLLQKLLSAKDHEFKLLSIENLGKLHCDAATNLLLECLATGDRIIADYASDCLATKPNLNIDILLQKLETDDENLRFQIIKIIGSIGGMALNPIVKILQKGNKQERLFLLGVLQRISPNDQLIEILIKLLGDINWPVRNAAANCLVNFGEASVPAIVKALNSSSDDIRFWSRKALLKIGPRAVLILKKILEEGNNPDLMPHIVSALLSMNHADAVPAVLKFLENSDEYRIESVFENIPEVTSKDVVNTILNLLTHPDDKVVKWLARLLEKVDQTSLRRSVFLGLSHSNERVRYYVSLAIASYDNLSENDVKVIARQLSVEKTKTNLKAIIRILSRFPYESTILVLEDFLGNCKPELMLNLMLETAKHGTAEFLEMLDRLLKSRSEVITINDVDTVGAILSHVYNKNPEGLIQGLTSPSMAYRLCCIIALDSIDDRKIAFRIMETLLPDEEPRVIKRAVKTLAKYFFHEDFRLKGAVTDFLLSLGIIITEPLTEYIQELENEIDRKALVDLIESVGGEVDSALLKPKGEAKVVMSDSHLDDVLERRKAAMAELEKYDEIIKSSHTMDLAVMFTDVKGYTEFSSKASLSEVMSMLKQHDEILQPVFEKYGGEALKKIGDSFLVVFDNHNNSLLSAIDIQRQLEIYNSNVSDEKKLAIRIAINSGSVIRTENDVLGDAVNLASRLEGIADAFEIVISEYTFERINKDIFEIEEYGVHSLKGIKKPIQAYKIEWNK
jgi:HEAT repeat protein/class 3 adenylate cyclase